LGTASEEQLTVEGSSESMWLDSSWSMVVLVVSLGFCWEGDGFKRKKKKPLEWKVVLVAGFSREKEGRLNQPNT